MPPEWGESGARLMFPLEILIESDRNTLDEEKDFMGGGSSRVEVLEDPIFVSSKGEEVIYFEESGAWKIGARRGKIGDASKLRFWVDLDKDTEFKGVAATRNDVTLPAERLYFVANCWRENEIDVGVQRFLPIKSSAEEAQEVIDRLLSHESGDRRLDGTNPLDTALASIDMAVLVAKRDESKQKLKEAERSLPNPSMDLSKPGSWPGTTDNLVIAPGTIFVKRASEGIFGGDEFHIVGTWSATPLATEEVASGGIADVDDQELG